MGVHFYSSCIICACAFVGRRRGTDDLGSWSCSLGVEADRLSRKPVAEQHDRVLSTDPPTRLLGIQLLAHITGTPTTTSLLIVLRLATGGAPSSLASGPIAISNGVSLGAWQSYVNFLWFKSPLNMTGHFRRGGGTDRVLLARCSRTYSPCTRRDAVRRSTGPFARIPSTEAHLFERLHVGLGGLRKSEPFRACC